MPNEPTTVFKPIPPKSLAPDMKAALLEAYAMTGTIREACDVAGVTAGQAYRWRKDDAEFGIAWDRVTSEVVVPKLEQAAIERAAEKSDLLLMFLLKAYRRERFDDRMALPSAPPDNGMTLVFNEQPPTIKDVNDSPVRHDAGADAPAPK